MFTKGNAINTLGSIPVTLSLEKLGYPCWLFSFGSIAGWLLEVAFRSAVHWHLTIPGFSYGPYCPIYGFGFLIIVYLCRGKNVLISYLKIVSLSSLMEYGLSWLTETLFNELLWDYSSLPFSIGTRVNLVFSLAWGILGLLVLTFLEPWLQKVYERGKKIYCPAAFGAIVMIISDVFVSVLVRIL